MTFKFQSTLSVRRATVLYMLKLQFVNISIHALRKESDSRVVGLPLPDEYFNPRSP